jgi:hypothetical protein
VVKDENSQDGSNRFFLGGNLFQIWEKLDGYFGADKTHLVNSKNT